MTFSNPLGLHALESNSGISSLFDEGNPPTTLSMINQDEQQFVRRLSPDDQLRLPFMKQLGRHPRAITDEEDGSSRAKKQRIGSVPGDHVDDGSNSPAPVLASKKGITLFRDNDVLSGRGGGTNVHPGNRNFRDLINLHRRAYLKARKNDKPAISRAIVKSIRDNNGRFLKKDEKSGQWFEIGDDAAREKTSQALRQRAPEMRRLIFDTERDEARVAAGEHLRQQRMIMGMAGSPDMNGGLSQVVSNSSSNMSPHNPLLNPALFTMANKNALAGINNIPNDPYSTMFSAALLRSGINRFTPNGA